eukprot:13359199-Alexandrium_andersonii.AAC.1
MGATRPLTSFRQTHTNGRSSNPAHRNALAQRFQRYPLPLPLNLPSAQLKLRTPQRSLHRTVSGIGAPPARPSRRMAAQGLSARALPRGTLFREGGMLAP